MRITKNNRYTSPAGSVQFRLRECVLQALAEAKS